MSFKSNGSERILNCFKRLFNKFKTKTKIYEATKWFFSEILLGLVIALALFLSSHLYDSYVHMKTEANALENLALVISKEYADSLFGTAKNSIYDEKTNLVHSFYSIDGCLVRISFYEDKAIAYFLIIIDKDRKIDLETHYGQNFILGKDLYSDLVFEVPQRIDVDYMGDSRGQYYTEWYNQGRWAVYNTVIYGTIPLFGNNSSAEKFASGIIFEAHKYKNLENTTDIATVIENVTEQRDKSKPNVFGVVLNGYEDHFDILSPINEWADIFQMVYSKAK